MMVTIVGGSGFIGRHLAAGLRARGDEVLILSREPRSARERLPRDLVVGRWAPSDPAALASVLRGADAVVNLAGVRVGPQPWTPGRQEAILESRLAATRAIVRAFALLDDRERPAVLVNASGTDTYTGRDASPADESTSPTNGFLGRVCLAWEAEAERARETGVRVALLRIGFVLAADAASLGLYALPFRLGLGGPLGDGRQWMSWIHIDDLVRLVLLAIDDRRVDGVVNAVSPEPARQADVAAAIGAALGRRAWMRVPAWLIRAAMGAQSVLPLGSRRIVPARALGFGFQFRWSNLDAAMADALGGHRG